MKYDKDIVEAQLNQEYFARKVDMVPASVKETYSDLAGKNPVLVSRELVVDDRPLIGIEYAPDGEVASVYTTDAKGRRVNFENTAEKATSNAAPDLISERLAMVKGSRKTLAYEPVHKDDEVKRVVARPRKPVSQTVTGREDR